MTSSHQNARLCSLCQIINVSRKLFPEQQSQLADEELSRENFIELGTSESISARADSCDLCSFVAGKIEEHERKFSDRWRKLEISGYALEWQSYGSESDKAGLPHATRHRLDIILQDDSGEDLAVMRIPSVLQPAVWPVPSLKSHLEDLTWPDYGSRGGRYRSLMCEPNIFGKWLRTCEKRHENCTLDSPAVPPVLRFIDTKLRCVSHAHMAANEGVRYVALSYVWGKNAQPLTLTRANFERLGEFHAIQHDDLPQTISDAIAVVEMLGERYLWVDALCIIQDNEDDLAAHLPLMGYIYEGALMTIIAASSTDANSGLPGVRQSRSPQHVIGPLGEGALLSCPSPMLEEILQFSLDSHHYLQNSRWNTRGWTLQEKLFSRRCLYFTEEQIYWECKMDSWCEDSCFESHPLDPVAEKRCSWKESGGGSLSTPFLEGIGLGTRMTTPEEHDYFSDLLWSYSHRSLSFSEDIERAFAGLLKVLSERTGAQFWYGLPIPIFDACIWLHVSKGTVQRSTTTWPSWSWLAWKGGLRMGNRYGPSKNDIPEIQCYRLCPCEGGQLSLERVSDRILSLEESRPVLKWDIPTAVWRVLQPNFHILFWAQTCTFDVEDGEGLSLVHHVLTEATEGDAGERLIGFVERNGHGNFPLPGHHEFTRFQTEPAHREGVDRDEYPQRHYAHLLSWHDGIAKREWSGEIYVDEWGKYTAPQWKLIIMG